MTSRKVSHLKPNRTQEIRGDELVSFRELPFLIASAIYEDGESRRLFEAKVEANLTAQVEAGSLIVRNRDTMQPLTLPAGEQIKRAVMWPGEARHLFDELFISLHIIEVRRGPELWTVRWAALFIGVQEQWTAATVDRLCEQMLEGARDGSLRVYDPQTGLTYRPDPVRDFYELVKPADVNAWLATRGAAYRWHAEISSTSAQGALVGNKPVETTNERKIRLYRMYREEVAKQERGALRRVADKDGRARQTVKSDIDKGEILDRETATAIGHMVRTIRR